LLLGGMRRLFFKRDAPPVEAPQRPDADADAARSQLLLKLDERDVRFSTTSPRRKVASASYDLRSPPCLIAATSPCFSGRSSQRIALDALTQTVPPPGGTKEHVKRHPPRGGED
jgi:hypothetical protein